MGVVEEVNTRKEGMRRGNCHDTVTMTTNTCLALGGMTIPSMMRVMRGTAEGEVDRKTSRWIPRHNTSKDAKNGVKRR